MLICDVIVAGIDVDCHSVDWSIHVPLMLHIITLGLDHSRLLVHQHCKYVFGLQNIQHSYWNDILLWLSGVFTSLAPIYGGSVYTCQVTYYVVPRQPSNRVIILVSVNIFCILNPWGIGGRVRFITGTVEGIRTWECHYMIICWVIILTKEKKMERFDERDWMFSLKSKRLCK